MKTRFSVNDRGELVSRDGLTLGRVTSITLDLNPAFCEPVRGATGGEKKNQKGESPEPSVDTEENPPSPRANVWAAYVELFGSRYELNDTRKRIIDNALKVRSEERCIRAVVGLSKSPWHNGQNEQQKKYLDIRYALKGNSARGESNDERIDKMAALADEADQRPAGPAPRIPDEATDMERMRLRSKLSELDVTDDEERIAYILSSVPPGFEAVQDDDGRWRFQRA